MSQSAPNLLLGTANGKARLVAAGAALLAGASLVLALPPFGWLVFLWVGVAGFGACLFYAHAHRPLTGWSALALGWLFGMGQFVAGLYWLGEATLVQAEKFGWAWPLAVFGAPAYLSLYYGLTIGAWARFALPLWPRRGALVLLSLAAAIWVAEFARSVLLTGFPWNLLGLAYAEYLPLAQAAAWVGVYGMSALALLFGLLPLFVWRARQLAIVVGVGLLALALWGQYRISQASPPDSALLLKLVQPNFAQATKWDPAQVPAQLQTLLELSAPVAPGMVVIWPEAAMGTFLAEEGDMLDEIAALLPPSSWLITGSVRRVWVAEADGRKVAFYNSVLAIDSDGRTRGHYDKYHLVPFGEYIPLLGTPLAARLQTWGLEALASLGIGYSAGEGPQRLELAALDLPQPLICYEAIFPHRLASPAPHWLLNLTNDAWFGDTIGPAQHLAAARLRAIESGRPLVRVANTGISAVYDAFGRERARLPLGSRGALSVRLPGRLAK